MYKVIVVDDEAIIRDKIIKSIPWNSLGFEILGEARNGKEAIEITEKLIPDVILTDIKMPVMDGIELIENISIKHPHIKLIIMSGYNEYEYLRQAIKNKVTDYLLKPTAYNEYLKVFEKIKIILDEEKEEKLMHERIRKQLFESLPYMRERFLNQLLKGFYKEEKLIKEKMDFYEIELMGNEVVVVILEIDNFQLVTTEFSEEKKQLLKLSIVYAANQVFSETRLGVFFLGNNDEIIGICNSDVGSEKLIVNIQKIRKLISDYKGITFSAGVSEECLELIQLAQFYCQAGQALKQKMFLGEDSIILFKDIKDIENTDNFMYSFNTEKIINNIFYNGEGELSACLDEVFDQFNNKASRQCDQVDNICIELLSFIFIFTLLHGALAIVIVFSSKADVLILPLCYFFI